MATVVAATRELRADEHLALMMATEPGETLSQLTVAGLPRIIRMATVTLTPLVANYVPHGAAQRLIDVLARLTISYFLAPSADIDLGDEILGAGVPAPGDRRARSRRNDPTH